MEFPSEIEIYRDRTWRRDPERRLEHVYEAERFVEEVGFCSALRDSRHPGPSLYVAVCGRRDAHMPRNVQKDPESSLAWTLKDEMMRRGKVFYSKLLKGHASLVARRLLPCFNSVFGLPAKLERSMLSADAQKILKVLRKEWEMGSRDLRQASGITDRTNFDRAVGELQKKLKIVPVDVLYQPSFTYIWSIPEARFEDELSRRVKRSEALAEIARAYLLGAGLSLRGELARVTGLSSPEAGSGNWTLVDEGFAERLGPGIYRLNDLTAAYKYQR
ncbi:MAG: hypothetical protein ABR555_15580 [Pyrinomonadaceae bacterium]